MNSKVIVFVVLLCLTGFGLLMRGYMPKFPQLQHISHVACDKCLRKVDPWLKQHLHKSVQPFLSANYSLPEDAFNWWKRLQLERRNYSSYSTTVDRLFQMFPNSPDLIESSPNQTRNCSLVGNSGNLRRSHYGPLIDFHDVVIRINKGHIKGYEADVGTKTTHHIMYPESAMDLDNSTHLVLFPFKIQDLEWLIKAFSTGFYGRSYAPIKPTIKANKDLVMVTNPAFMRYVHDIWLEKKGDYPSTGFMAVILALNICDEVHVFGYGADTDGNWSHYFEEFRNKQYKTGLHPGSHEYDIIKELAKRKILHFYAGS
ncbi:CMP-N-acetylneuraminate-beta-galactosamide-alpha-2,3-sialyltransferase 1-like [Scomber japonicus]|uniref:CMP-N-acetylneuraminate-beta-galactosamide- alpha-2,3-sialyltransferase 1-like n=1 Tax=Scomber japonicus TaxID=13676 RepID=UPI002305FA8E|nr:CMP-N-acetylneuraminate-beta-galactosamide-alpha-2,3-sialyltransferase 1-like [Scomber japonicus]